MLANIYKHMEENNEPQEEVKEDSDLLNPVADEAEETADDSEVEESEDE